MVKIAASGLTIFNVMVLIENLVASLEQDHFEIEGIVIQSFGRRKLILDDEAAIRGCATYLPVHRIRNPTFYRIQITKQGSQERRRIPTRCRTSLRNRKGIRIVIADAGAEGEVTVGTDG